MDRRRCLIAGRMHHGIRAAVISVCIFAIVALGVVTLARSIVQGAELIARTALLAPVPNRLPVPSNQTEAVSLFIVGDVMLDRGVATWMAASRNDLYPFHRVLADRRFTEPDLRIMNLEGPVTGERRPPEKAIDFAFAPSVIHRLTLTGWNAASQANNHSRDQGAVGAEDSRSRLAVAGILVFGDEVDDGAVAMATGTVRGRRLAFVGFNDTSRRIDASVAAGTLFRARSEADTVVVMAHWGDEYQDHPTERQEELGRWFVDQGADVVVGSHPHWVQGVEIYKGKPILYSLGNFVFDQGWSTATSRGLAATFLIRDTGIVVALDPVTIQSGAPFFATGDERALRLAELASISSADLAHQIREGHISIPVMP